MNMNKQIFQCRFLWLFVALSSILLVQDDSRAQFGEFGGGNAPKVTASAEFQLKSGSKTEGIVTVTATVLDGFHIYSVTQKKGGPLPTRISVVAPEEGVMFGAFTPDKPAKIHRYEEAYGDLEIAEHTGKVIWTAPITFESPIEDPVTVALKLIVTSLACTNDLGICVPQKNEITAGYKGDFKPQPTGDGNESPAEKDQAIDEPSGIGLSNSPFDLGGGFQSPGLGGGFESPGTGNDRKELKATAGYYVNPQTGNGVVRIQATVTDGFHIYSLTQKRGGPLPTILKVTGQGIQISGEVVSDKEPEIHHYEVYGELDVEEVRGTVNWDVPILAPPGDPTGLKIKVIVDALACTDDLGSCIPQKVNTDAELDMSLAGLLSAPVTSDAEQDNRSQVSADSVGSDGQTDELSLTVVLGFALLGGFILNFMPCVLPVIGLKIMSFVTQAGESRGKIFSLNLWYSLGLMTVFLVFASLAIFMGLGWGQQNQSDSFNIIMIAVIFVMGLSFIGVWEIPIPGFVGSSEMAKSAEKEGPLAAYLKGIITTLLAIPCSGPGLGVALTYCAKQMAQEGGTQGAFNVYLVFFTLGIGMAFPYLVIGAFPGLVRFLPKPGTWMETFKELMGYILLATIVFIMTYIGYSLIVPTIGFLFALWAGCWWYGRVPFTAPAGTKIKHRLGAIIFASLLGWFCFGWFATEMEGRLEAFVEKQVLERQLEGGGVPIAIKEGEKNLYTASRLAELINQDKRLVMVDFTADWCLTCKLLKKAVLDTDAVQSTLNEHEVVQLVADWTEMDSKTGLEIDAELEKLGKGKQLPIIAFYSPGQGEEPRTLVGAYTAGEIQSILKELNK
ncbi:MAG: hypothetical protein CMJ76_02725 [Planctomycetaceae bacterium]|nr:hypothetical protein [Planctomycetaceae bacterium]